MQMEFSMSMFLISECVYVCVQRVFVLPNMDDIYLPIMVPLQHTA